MEERGGEKLGFDSCITKRLTTDVGSHRLPKNRCQSVCGGHYETVQWS